MALEKRIQDGHAEVYSKARVGHDNGRKDRNFFLAEETF